jgi:hypothetical protein
VAQGLTPKPSPADWLQRKALILRSLGAFVPSQLFQTLRPINVTDLPALAGNPVVIQNKDALDRLFAVSDPIVFN